MGKIGGKLIGSLAGKAGDVADSTLQAQFKSPIDQSVVGNLGDSGLTDARQVAQIAPILSGPSGTYTNMVQQALEEAGNNGARVNVSSLDSHLGELLGGGDTGTGAEILTKGQAQKANDFVQKVISPDNLNANPEKDVAIMTTSPAKTYQAFQKLRNASNVLRNGSGAQPGTPNNALSQVYSKMANILKDMSFTPDGINSIPLTDDMKSQLIDNIGSIKDINPKVYASEVQNITNASKLSDLNDMQADWVQASKALQKGATTGAVNTGTSASDIAAGLAPLTLAHPLMTAAGLAMKSDTADRGATSVLSGLSKALGSSGAKKYLPLLTRATGVATTNLPNDVAQPNNVQSMTGTPMTPQANPLTSNPDSLASILSTLVPELNAPGADLLPGYSSLSSLVGSLAPTVQKQELLAPGIENALSTFANAGGAQGTGGGLLSRVTGLISGTPANTYNAASTAAAAQLSQLLGISVTEAQAMLPQLMQSQATAAPQVGGIQSILGSLGQPSAIPAQ